MGDKLESMTDPSCPGDLRKRADVRQAAGAKTGFESNRRNRRFGKAFPQLLGLLKWPGFIDGIIHYISPDRIPSKKLFQSLSFDSALFCGAETGSGFLYLSFIIMRQVEGAYFPAVSEKDTLAPVLQGTVRL